MSTFIENNFASSPFINLPICPQLTYNVHSFLQTGGYIVVHDQKLTFLNFWKREEANHSQPASVWCLHPWLLLSPGSPYSPHFTAISPGSETLPSPLPSFSTPTYKKQPPLLLPPCPHGRLCSSSLSKLRKCGATPVWCNSDRKCGGKFSASQFLFFCWDFCPPPSHSSCTHISISRTAR